MDGMYNCILNLLVHQVIGRL